jgi:hypothetical protein
MVVAHVDMGTYSWLRYLTQRVSTPTLETLAGCFVLSVFCESLIMDPLPFTSVVFMSLINPG